MTSLLRPHSDPSMRPPADKEISAVDLDQLFGQYGETDVFQQLNSHSTADPSRSDDLAHLFELPSSNGSDSFQHSTLPIWATSEDDAWHKAILKLEEQNPASPRVSRETSSSVYPESGGVAPLSDPELFSFDEIFESDVVEPRAVSQPSTPKTTAARPAKKTRQSPDRSIRHGIHKPTKKPSISSIAGKMMQSSHYRTGFQDIWSRKLDSAADTFNLQMPQHTVTSPPPSSKIPQDESTNGFFARDGQPYTMSPDHTTASPDLQPANYQLTPLSSPAIDMNSSRSGTGNPFQFSNDGMASAYISHHISNAALSALQTPPPSHRVPMSAWGTNASPNLDFSGFDPADDYQSTKTNSWWNSTSPVSVTQPSTPSTYQTSGTTSQNLGYSTASVTGLGISCDTASFSNLGPELENSSNGIQASASSFDMGGYASLYTQTAGIPIGTHPANPPSRSPSLSPQPRFTRRRPSNQQHAHQSNTRTSHRRKSSNSSTNSHSHSSSHRTSAGNGAGFVNFTPHDSRKILTGVAPSGSSKTKARREKEAADKRRKLSQAAVRAVVEAGGDLRGLEEEGLLV